MIFGCGWAGVSTTYSSDSRMPSLSLRLLRATGTWNNPLLMRRCTFHRRHAVCCFAARMQKIRLSHTHKYWRKPSCPSDLSIRGSQADGTDERSRNNSIFHPANLYLWSRTAAIDSALAWLFTHSPEERGASDRSGDGGMLGKARRLINVTLVYSDRGLWGERRLDSYTKMPSCSLLVHARQNFTGKKQWFSRCRPSQSPCYGAYRLATL